MHVLLIADAVYLYSLSPEQSLTEIGIAHGAAILALWLFRLFLPFIHQKKRMTFKLELRFIHGWRFCHGQCGGAYHERWNQPAGFLASPTLQRGCKLELLSLYILIICSVLLPMLLFLGMLPKDEQKHNRGRNPQVPERHDTFLFSPLMAGYLLVLYVYAARIFISWELPGLGIWLVVALMAGCIAIEFGLYPVRIQEKKPINEWIARWLPALVLPMLVLVTIGIIRRFNDYGVTINRLYLITLNIWCYIVLYRTRLH